MAAAVDGDDKHAVGNRMAAEHRVPRLVLGGVEILLAIEPADRGGIEDRLGAGHRRQPGGFGIPLIPADERPDGELRRRHAHEAGVAGGEIKLLVVVRVIGDVHLPVEPGLRAIGIEDHRGVVEEAGRAALEDARHDDDTMRLRGSGDALGERPGHDLRLREPPMLLCLAGILPGEQLLEADDVGPETRRLGDPGQGLRDIRLAVGGAARLDQPDPHDARGQRRPRRGRLPAAQAPPLPHRRPAHRSTASSFAAGTGYCSASSATSRRVVAITCSLS